jgi:hypothetical protein
MEGEQAQRWRRFDELRRPEQMRQWAEAAGLPEFEVMGDGAISAADARVGQGVWLMFKKQPEVVASKDTDTITVRREGDTTFYSITSPNGIGGATISRGTSWPARVVVRLHLRGLESFRLTSGDKTVAVSVLSHGRLATSQTIIVSGRERQLKPTDPLWILVERFNSEGQPIEELPGEGGYFQLTLPETLLADRPTSLVLQWIDFHR